MKKVITLIFLSTVFISCGYAQQSQTTSQINLTSFTKETPKITKELDARTSNEFKNHPEYGVLPFNAPCKECFEVLQKRDQKHRYFLKQGTNGTQFYAQSSYGDLSYVDSKGTMRTIDYRLQPAVQHGVFTASRQPFPVTVNVQDKYISILNAGKELRMNRNVSLFVQNPNGTLISLGEPSWSDYTAGDDGVVIHNFYPGIDLEMRLGEGKVETFYRINKPLQLNGGNLVIRDNVQLPKGFVYDYSYSEKKDGNYYEGALCINNEKGTRYFIIGNPAAIDENSSDNDHVIGLQYAIGDAGNYDLYIPISWMNDSKRSYPLVIDPYVTATSTLPQASITGSGYNSTCFTGGCTYSLPVVVPAACTVTDVLYSFNYRALGTCNLNQGAWDLTFSTCRSPAASGQWHTCTIGLPGLCILQDLSLYTDIKTCIPAPQCASYNMPFVLTFYRCVQSGSGCGFSCINADTPWDMTVTGYTALVTSANVTDCQGTGVNLTATPDSGAAAYTYTYKWSPGGLTGKTVTVSPSANTTYTVTQIACGVDTSTAVATVTVTPNDNPGFTLSPNPACPGGAVAITGNNGRPLTSYDWTLPGGTPSVISDSKSFNVSYASPGTYTITLIDSSGNCVFDSAHTIVVSNITASAGPDTSICSGTSVTLNASGGTSYSWSPGGLTSSSVTVSPSNSTTYTVTATSGSCNATTTVTVVVIPSVGNQAPDIFVNPDSISYSITTGDSLSILVTVTDSANNTVYLTGSSPLLSGGYNASFSPSVDSSNTGTVTRTFKYISSCSDAKASPFKVTFTGSKGKSSICGIAKDTTYSITITVLPPSSGLLDTIPNIFTPNGDHLNDSLSLYHAADESIDCWSNFHIEIFNRWGESEYESTDFRFSWDGNNKSGDKVSEGVYYYIITADYLGSPVTKKGTVNVKR